MKIDHFIKRDFNIASPFTGVADLKKQLLNHSAVVIIEDEQYFGVLTALDIVRKPHILAIDCPMKDVATGGQWRPDLNRRSSPAA